MKKLSDIKHQATILTSKQAAQLIGGTDSTQSVSSIITDIDVDVI